MNNHQQNKSPNNEERKHNSYMEHKINNLQEELNKLRAEKDENTNSLSTNSEIVNNK